MKEKYLCEFCDSYFSRSTVLSNHQKSNKKCLKLQGKTCTEIFSCKFCDKSFSIKGNKNRHEKSCKSNTIIYKPELDSDEEYLTSEDEEEITDKDEYIKELKNQINMITILNQNLIKDKRSLENRNVDRITFLENRIEELDKELTTEEEKNERLIEQIKSLQEDNKTLILYYQKEIKKKDKKIQKRDKEINKLTIKNYQTELSHKTLTIENLYLKDDKNLPLKASNNKLPEFNKQNCVFDNKRLEECMKKITIDDLYNPFKSITKKIFKFLLLDTKNQLIYVSTDPNRHNYMYYDKHGRKQRDMGGNQLSLFIQPELHKRLVVLKQDFIKDKGSEDFDHYIKPILDIQSLSDKNTMNRFFREIDKLILGHVNDIVNKENAQQNTQENTDENSQHNSQEISQENSEENSEENSQEDIQENNEEDTQEDNEDIHDTIQFREEQENNEENIEYEDSDDDSDDDGEYLTSSQKYERRMGFDKIDYTTPLPESYYEEFKRKFCPGYENPENNG